MAVALVQKKGAQSAGNTSGLVVTLDAPPTPGNLLVAACNSDATVSTPAGFTLAVSAVSGQGLYIFYRVVQVGDGSSVTFAPSVADSCAGGVIEYSGLTATPLDQTASNTTNASATSLATGTTPTTNQASELVIVVVGPHANNNHPWVLSSWSAGYTSQVEEPNGLATIGSASSACHIGDQIVGATGTYSATGTWAPASSDAGAAIATFKAVAGTVHALAATGLVSTTGSAALNVTIVLAATGLAATTGSAALAVNVTLGATGLAATSGAMDLAVRRVLASDGLAATTGTFGLNLILSLAAVGLAATAGSMNLGAPVHLAATGLAATTGTFGLNLILSLAAVGLAATAGSMNLGAPVHLAATGLAATTGSFAFASANPYYPAPTKVTMGASDWPKKVAL